MDVDESCFQSSDDKKGKVEERSKINHSPNEDILMSGRRVQFSESWSFPLPTLGKLRGNTK